MKPPMKGASSGPVKTVMEKTVMAMPRVRLSNMSEKIAATTASGQAPKKPAKKRVMRTVWRSLATACGDVEDGEAEHGDDEGQAAALELGAGAPKRSGRWRSRGRRRRHRGGHLGGHAELDADGARWRRRKMLEPKAEVMVVKPSMAAVAILGPGMLATCHGGSGVLLWKQTTTRQHSSSRAASSGHAAGHQAHQTRPRSPPGSAAAEGRACRRRSWAAVVFPSLLLGSRPTVPLC